MAFPEILGTETPLTSTHRPWLWPQRKQSWCSQKFHFPARLNLNSKTQFTLRMLKLIAAMSKVTIHSKYIVFLSADLDTLKAFPTFSKTQAIIHKGRLRWKRRFKMFNVQTLEVGTWTPWWAMEQFTQILETPLLSPPLPSTDCLGTKLPLVSKTLARLTALTHCVIWVFYVLIFLLGILSFSIMKWTNREKLA